MNRLDIQYVKPVTTRERILNAARDLLVSGQGRVPAVGKVAARAGVSRLTVYHHFGSHAGLLAAVTAVAGRPRAPGPRADPRERLRELISGSCSHWASDAALFRRLPTGAEPVDTGEIQDLAAALAADDRLRPGCSLREAEDVIAIATSFAAFDRLHHDGRRSPSAVADILERIASTVLS